MDNFRDSYFQVDWDLTTKRLRGTYWGKQYDTGRGFAVTVINGGQVVAPTTEVLRLKWEKPDNTSGYVNATVVNGKFIVENIDQMFTVHGSVRADFELSVGGEFVASITFYVNVEKAVAVDAVESSSDFSAFQQSVADFSIAMAAVTPIAYEIIDARDGEVSVGAKIRSVDTQLAQRATQTYVDTKVASVASGSPKGTYATLEALQTAFPTGTTGVYVVTANGNWYYWNGSAWTAGGTYQSTGVADNSVTPKKLDNVFYQSAPPNFEQGDLTPAGIDMEDTIHSDRRIRCTPFYANPLTRLTVGSGVRIYVHYFDLNNNTVKLGDSGDWVTGDISIPYECNVRILAVYWEDYLLGSKPPVLFTTVEDLASKISVANFAYVDRSIDIPEPVLPDYITTKSELLLSRIGLKRVAHRGYSTVAPENTIPAVIEAGNANFWGCECDAIKSSDGVWFVMHDTTVDRTTNGTGMVRDMTTTEIKELTIDDGPNIENYPNLKVPTVKEYLLACKKHNLVPIIHVDSGSSVNATLVNDVIASGLINKTIFVTYYQIVIETLKNIDNRVITQILTTSGESTEEQIKAKIDYIATVKNNAGIGVVYNYLTQSIIDYAHTKNVVVSTFTLNDSETAETLIDYGLDMITTDELTS